tara:strand:- start:2608 stop:3492 length:885 start_codon:yes stop_codon:yes gene_type:complete
MFSILIPTFNNIEYLKICIDSIKKNSNYNHQIILHINNGSDGTLEYAKKNNLQFTYSQNNIGMPKALNKSSSLSNTNYILISHDDFYYCPDWDKELIYELEKLKTNYFYLSGTMVGAGQVYFDAGNDFSNFDEKKLLENLQKIKTFNFQGTTKCPGLVHKYIWTKVGGWSEEFSPTGGDDTDFAMKLWKNDVRIFKGIGTSLVYHFGSITTRKKDKKFFTYLGNRGNKIFLKKWGITINFFENKYLRAGLNKEKKLNFRPFLGPLKQPTKDINYFIGWFKCIILKFYLIITNFK